MRRIPDLEAPIRLSLRFILPLLLVLGAFAYAILPLVDRLTVRWFVRDLDIRADLIANTAKEPLQELIEAGNRARMLDYFTRITEDERIFAVGYCQTPAELPLATPSMPPSIRCDQLGQFAGPSGHVLVRPSGSLLVSVKPLTTGTAPDGQLVLVHDMSFVERRSEETRRYLFYFFIGLGLTVSLITVVIAQLSWRGWQQGVRALLRGEGLFRPAEPARSAGIPADRPGPAAPDSRPPVRASRPHRRPAFLDTGDPARTAHGELRGQEVIVVSNREPYIHVHQGGQIVVQRPASGLVTAVEPIMRACSGTWIAHGSGSADREVVDAHDRVGVPPRRSRLPDPPRLAHARSRKRATTTALQTRGSGRSATSPTCARSSGPLTGSSIARSMRSLPGGGGRSQDR